MENASKALLMAGGILIAILIIAVLIRTYNNISIFQKTKLSEEEEQQLIAFNEQYTKYLGQYVYGTEVITVINKALDNENSKITVTIKFNEGYSYTKKEWNRKTQKYELKEISIGSGKTLNITNENDEVLDVINNPSKTDDSLMRRAFKCTNIGYDSYGRVNSINFEEKKWGELK